MLLGSIVFVMSLFYLVHHPDKDIKGHSWCVISSTISIFTSVLLYQGSKGVVDTVVERFVAPALRAEGREALLIVWEYLQAFDLFVVLHVIIWTHARKHAEHGSESEGSHEDLEQRMSCWSTIFGHMTGFAFISAGCATDHAGGGGALLSFGTALFMSLILFVAFRASDGYRNYSGRAATEAKMTEVWEEAAEEAENDVAALCLSFLVVQACIQCITGQMPHEGRRLEGGIHAAMHGYVQEAEVATEVSILWLLGLSALFGVTTVVSVWSGAFLGLDREFHSQPGLDSLRLYVQRWVYILQTTCAMGFAWCLLFAAKWQIGRLLFRVGSGLEEESTVQRVFLALTISLLAFILIFILDKIDDLKATSESVQRCTRSLSQALGILIGFSWESSFNGGVEVLAELSKGRGVWCPVWLKLLMAVAVCGIVVPAWRLYILQTVLRIREEKRLRRQREENPELTPTSPRDNAYLLEDDR